MINGRKKGHAFELKISKELKPWFPRNKRRLEYQALEERGIDLDETGRFRFQLKRKRLYSPINTIEEVDYSGNQIPVLITKADRQPVLLAMYCDDFDALLLTNNKYKIYTCVRGTGKKYAPIKAIFQCITKDKGDNWIPRMITEEDGKRFVAVILLDDFKRLLYTITNYNILKESDDVK